MASHQFEGLFERLGIHAHSSPQAPSREETLGLFLAIFVLFNLVFRLIDELPYLTIATIHLIAYAICSFIDFPLNVAADVLISTFFIITIFKLVFYILDLVHFGGLGKWIFLVAAAYSFVAGPEQSSSYGNSYWVDIWNDGMGTVHKYLVTIGIGLAGIFVGFFKEGRYDSPLFRKSAALFATIRAAIQAYYGQLVAER